MFDNIVLWLTVMIEPYRHALILCVLFGMVFIVIHDVYRVIVAVTSLLQRKRSKVEESNGEEFGISEPMEDGIDEVVLPFLDQSKSYTYGFEAGYLHHMLSNSNARTVRFDVRADNLAMIHDIAHYSWYDLEIVSREDDKVTILLTRSEDDE